MCERLEPEGAVNVGCATDVEDGDIVVPLVCDHVYAKRWFPLDRSTRMRQG